MERFYKTFGLAYDKNGYVDNPYFRDLYQKHIKGQSTDDFEFIIPNYRFYKSIMDAYVLLPRLYESVGLDSIKFMPVKLDKTTSGLVYSKKKCHAVSYYQLYDDLRKKYGIMFDYDNKFLFKSILSFVVDESLKPSVKMYKNNPLLEYFELKAIKDKIITNLMNVACKNNVFLDEIFYTQGKNGHANGVISSDFCASGINFQIDTGRRQALMTKLKKCLSGSQKEIKYPNDFVTNSVDSKTIACLVKGESGLEKYFSKKEQEEFAKKLSSLDVNKISQQTKDEVNYSVDKKYVDYLQRSVDDFAEELQR